MRRLLPVALVFAAVGAARADDPPAPPTPLLNAAAVLVGVGKFDDPAVPARPTAEADARALAKVLADPKVFAAPDRVAVLTGQPEAGEKAATPAAVAEAVHQAVASTKKGDTVVIGLFGRGATAGKATVFLTPGATAADPGKTGLLMTALDKDLRALRDRKLVFLLDVNFKPDGEKEGEGKKLPDLRDLFLAVFDEEEDSDGYPTRNHVLYLAARPGQPLLSENGRGLFATTLIAGLTGGADTKDAAPADPKETEPRDPKEAKEPAFPEGGEPDGYVTADELIAFVRKTAQAKAKELGKTDQEKEAVPVALRNDRGRFPLARFAKAADDIDARVAKVGELEKAGALNKAEADDARKVLARMPKLKAEQNLRKAAAALTGPGGDPAAFKAERQRIKEGLALPENEVKDYALKVLRAVGVATRDYYKPVTPGEWTAHAVNGLYWQLDEPVPAALADKLKNPKGIHPDDLYDILRETRAGLGRREDLDGDKGVDATIAMMFADNHDPYSVYFTAEQSRQFTTDVTATFVGIGCQIRRDAVRDAILVVSPIKDGPAHKAGVQAGDYIVEVRRDSDPQGEPLKPGEPAVISTKGMESSKAVELLLGKAGVPVTIVVERNGKTLEPINLRRARVQMETAFGVKRDEKGNWDFYVDPANQIGYVRLNKFAPSTADELERAIKKMQAGGGLKGLVLDLRFNGGGLLDTAVKVCDTFLDDPKKVVVVRNRQGQESPRYGAGAGVYPAPLPLAVLVNEGSASASEVTAACLQDYKRAVVVGERTFGKGSVQSERPFDPTGGAIKITTARYFPPSDRNIDKRSTTRKPEDEWGVKPDAGLEVKITEEERYQLEERFQDLELLTGRDPQKKPDDKDKKPFADKQLEKALEHLRAEIAKGPVVKKP